MATKIQKMLKLTEYNGPYNKMASKHKCNKIRFIIFEQPDGGGVKKKKKTAAGSSSEALTGVHLKLNKKQD